MTRVNLIHNFENFTFPQQVILRAKKKARTVHLYKCSVQTIQIHVNTTPVLYGR